MSNALQTLLAMFGLDSGPADIELPNESGQVDPRLPDTWATQKVGLQNAGKTLQDSFQRAQKLRKTFGGQ